MIVEPRLDTCTILNILDSSSLQYATIAACTNLHSITHNSIYTQIQLRSLTLRRPRRRIDPHNRRRPSNTLNPQQHRNNPPSLQRKLAMPHNLQDTRDSARMRRQRQKRAPIMAQHIKQQFAQPRITRRVRLPQLRLIQPVVFCEARLKPVRRVLGCDGGARRAPVARVQADRLAQQLRPVSFRSSTKRRIEREERRGTSLMMG